MGILHLGPMVIKIEWIIFILSVFFIYAVLRYWLKEEEEFRVKYVDALFNAAFIGFLTFKFSLILFKPGLVIENPSSLLFYTGGTKGIILGVILAIVYLVWKTRKEKWQATTVLLGILYTTLTFLTSFWLLRTLYYLIF